MDRVTHIAPACMGDLKVGDLVVPVDDDTLTTVDAINAAYDATYQAWWTVTRVDRYYADTVTVELEESTGYRETHREVDVDLTIWRRTTN